MTSHPVRTTCITDTTAGPNPPSTTWTEDGRLLGGVQSTDRANPCTFPTRMVVDAMRRYADGVDVKDPWFLNERAARTHIARVRKAALDIESGDLSVVEDQHPIALSPLRCGLSLLAKEAREGIDMVDAMRIWKRENSADDY